MQSASVVQLKRAFRKAHLQRLRAWAKAEPSQLQSASQQLCDHLYRYIQARYRSPAATAQLPPTPLFILAYLPLYYEVDLEPLLRKLWPIAPAQRIHIFTPVVLSAAASPPRRTTTTSDAAPICMGPQQDDNPLHSAMVFVEVMDEVDLEATYAPQGKFQIREFPASLLEPWLRGPKGMSTAETSHDAASSNGFSSHGPTLTANHSAGMHPRQDGRVRHMVLCDSYARLFPAAHAAGYRPDGLVDYTTEDDATSSSPAFTSVRESGAAPQLASGSSEHSDKALHLDDVSMLVLTPGVLFDVQTGRRIGKGCGYYDRFLAYHAHHHSAAKQAVLESHSAIHSSAEEDAAALNTQRSRELLDQQCTSAANPLWEVMAVAFDSQVVRRSAADAPSDAPPPEQIPVDHHDQLMHTVVSPSGGVEVVADKPEEYLLFNSFSKIVSVFLSQFFFNV